MMPDDEFLRVSRPRPRPEFQAALFRRLQALPPARPAALRLPFLPRLALLGGALAVLLVAVLAASPVARAQLEGVLRMVGGIAFNETGASPGPVSAEAATTVPEETLSLAEAKSTLPFALAVPAWAPTGYALQDEVVVLHFNASSLTIARLVWYSDRGQVIDLSIQSPSTATWTVGPDSLESVTVNGQPAALLHGMWNADTGQWDPGSAVTLSWVRGSETYHLSSSDGSTHGAVLIRMAESIP